jgi:hypothetical protein
VNMEATYGSQTFEKVEAAIGERDDAEMGMAAAARQDQKRVNRRSRRQKGDQIDKSGKMQ